MTMAESKTAVYSAPPKRGLIISLALLLGLIAAILFNTKFVKIGSTDDVRKKVFSKAEFGAAQFPKVQTYILEHAVDAKILGAAIAADKDAAGKKYGVATTTGPVLAVTLTGIAGEVKSGIYSLAVDGLPEGTAVRVQTGPAVNGTDLRDSTGAIVFGQFTNQIEYQDAGSALNNEMKQQVLVPLDTTQLTTKKITVTGVFKLINPKNWLITPVKLAVE